MDDTPLVSPFKGTAGNYNPSGGNGSGSGSGGGGTVAIEGQWDYQENQQVSSNGQIELSGKMQVVPVYGATNEAIPNPVLFGTSHDLGVMVNLIGIDPYYPLKIVDSRNTNYGLKINGDAILYDGYVLQLQLVEIGNLKTWIEILKNF